MRTLIVQHVGDTEATFTVMRHDPAQTTPETATVTPPESFEAEGLEQTDLRRELRWYLERFLDYPFPPTTERADRVLGAARARGLSRDAESSFATPPDLDPRPVSGTVSAWLALAREGRAELKRLGESIRTAEAAAELARIDGRPDVTVWMKYRARSIDTSLDDGTDQISAGFSIPIPWGSAKRSRAKRAAQLQVARAGRARMMAELDRIESDLAAIHSRWTRAFEQAVEYRDNLTPDARATLETSLSDYTVGRADFSTLFEAEVALLDLERTLLSATVQTHIQAAAADATIGVAPRGGRH